MLSACVLTDSDSDSGSKGSGGVYDSDGSDASYHPSEGEKGKTRSKRKRRTTVLNRKNPVPWWDYYDQLVSYGNKHNDYNVPTSKPRKPNMDEDYSNLGKWLKNQRNRLKRQTLPDDKFDALMSLCETGRLWCNEEDDLQQELKQENKTPIRTAKAKRGVKQATSLPQHQLVTLSLQQSDSTKSKTDESLVDDQYIDYWSNELKEESLSTVKKSIRAARDIPRVNNNLATQFLNSGQTDAYYPTLTQKNISVASLSYEPKTSFTAGVNKGSISSGPLFPSNKDKNTGPLFSKTAIVTTHDEKDEEESKQLNVKSQPSSTLVDLTTSTSLKSETVDSMDKHNIKTTISKDKQVDKQAQPPSTKASPPKQQGVSQDKDPLSGSARTDDPSSQSIKKPLFLDKINPLMGYTAFLYTDDQFQGTTNCYIGIGQLHKVDEEKYLMRVMMNASDPHNVLTSSYERETFEEDAIIQDDSILVSNLQFYEEAKNIYKLKKQSREDIRNCPTYRSMYANNK